MLTAKEKLDRAYNTAFTRGIDFNKIKSLAEIGAMTSNINFIAIYFIHNQQHSLLETQPFWVILWKGNLAKEEFKKYCKIRLANKLEQLMIVI